MNEEEKRIAIAETFLNQVRGYMEYASYMEKEYDGLLCGMNSGPAARRYHRGGSVRMTDDRYADMIELHDRQKRARKAADQFYDIAIKALNKLEDVRLRQTLWEHYILGRTISEIAEQNSVSSRTVKRWKKQGLLGLELPERLREKLVELVDQEEEDQAGIRAMNFGPTLAQSDSTETI